MHRLTIPALLLLLAALLALDDAVLRIRRAGADARELERPTVGEPGVPVDGPQEHRSSGYHGIEL